MASCEPPPAKELVALREMSPCVSASLWPEGHDRAQEASCCELDGRASDCSKKIFFFLHVHKAGGTSLCNMAISSGH
eukprot:5996229-Prymnesium_polylepis.1